MEYYTSPIWLRYLWCSTKGRARQRCDSSSSRMLNTRILKKNDDNDFFVYFGMLRFFRMVMVKNCILVKHVNELISMLYFLPSNIYDYEDKRIGTI